MPVQIVEEEDESPAPLVEAQEAGQAPGAAFVFPFQVDAGRNPTTDITVVVHGRFTRGNATRTATRTFRTADLVSGGVTVTLI